MSRLFLTIIAAAFLSGQGDLWASDWPQFRGPNANGISPEKGISKNWNEKPPRMLWKVAMSDDGYAGPSVASGKVFIIDHKDTEDIVRAIDIRTGKDVWQYSYPNTDPKNHGFSRATPLVDRGRLYTLSYPGLVNCLDARNGKKLWSRDICAEFKGNKPEFGYSMSLLVDGNKLIVCPGGPDASMAALDKTTGATIWQGGESDRAAYVTPQRVTLDGRLQYLTVTANHVIGVDATNGALLWSFEWKTHQGLTIPAPIAIGDSVFVTSGYGYGCALIDVSGDGAKARWQNKEVQAHFSSPVYIDGHIYGNSDPGHLVCLDPQTGKVKWKQPGFEKGPVVAVDGVLLAFDGAGGDLVMVEATPQAYHEMGRFKPLGGPSWTAPIISNGNLIVRNKAELSCFSLQ